MLYMTQLLAVFKNLFTDKGYGESLHDYIKSHNPQTPADIEFLERQWLYGHMKNTGGQWL